MIKFIKDSFAWIIVFLAGFLLCFVFFHMGFLCGYETREAELGTLESLEQRGLISAEHKE